MYNNVTVDVYYYSVVDARNRRLQGEYRRWTAAAKPHPTTWTAGGMVATPQEMQAAMIANLPEKTGRSLDEWVEVLRQSGLEKHGRMVSLLKEHGMGHGYANLIAHVARGHSVAGAAERASESAGASRYTGVDPVEGQFAGKEDLRPIYDEVVSVVRGFGDDVELAPKKAYVSLRRNTQFGLVQPSTKTRIDVGLKLGGMEPEGRLERSGSWQSMVTHRVRVTSLADVDDELIGWLREAYERDG